MSGHETPDHLQPGREDEPRRPVDPLPLEPVAETVICPRCGAALPAGAEIADCPRCGTNSVAGAPPPVPASDDDDDLDAAELAAEVLVTPSRLDRWAVPALVIAGSLALVIGRLAGAGGLFGTEVVPPGAERLVSVARLIASLALWTGCGLVGLALASWLLERWFGDVRRAALRVLAVAAVSRTVTFLDLPWSVVEYSAETILQAALALGLVMVLFSLRLREAVMVVVLATASFVALLMMAEVVAWVT